MIDAIGIYKMETNGKLILIKSAPTKKSFFTSDPLADYERNIEEQYPLLEVGRPYHFIIEGRHQYLKKFDENTIVTIVGKTKWEKLEVKMLYTNINHILIRPEIVKRTLDDMVINPLEFVNKELHMTRIQESLEENKKIARENMDKIIDRGIKIDELKDKTVELKEDSIKFKKKAEKLKPFCSYC